MGGGDDAAVRWRGARVLVVAPALVLAIGLAATATVA